MTKREIKQRAKDLISDGVLRIEAGGLADYPDFLTELDEEDQGAVWEMVWVLLGRLDK